MSLNFGQIILKSQDHMFLGSFLSDFFDVNIIYQNEDVLIELDGMNIKITPIKDIVEESSIFNIRVDSINELDELIQKYQFVMYKNGKSEFDVPQIINNENEQYFEIVDIDGRTWRFSSYSM